MVERAESQRGHHHDLHRVPGDPAARRRGSRSVRRPGRRAGRRRLRRPRRASGPRPSAASTILSRRSATRTGCAQPRSRAADSGAKASSRRTSSCTSSQPESRRDRRDVTGLVAGHTGLVGLHDARPASPRRLRGADRRRGRDRLADPCARAGDDDETSRPGADAASSRQARSSSAVAEVRARRDAQPAAPVRYRRWAEAPHAQPLGQQLRLCHDRCLRVRASAAERTAPAGSGGAHRAGQSTCMVQRSGARGLARGARSRGPPAPRLRPRRANPVS